MCISEHKLHTMKRFFNYSASYHCPLHLTSSVQGRFTLTHLQDVLQHFLQSTLNQQRHRFLHQRTGGPYRFPIHTVAIRRWVCSICIFRAAVKSTFLANTALKRDPLSTQIHGSVVPGRFLLARHGMLSCWWYVGKSWNQVRKYSYMSFSKILTMFFLRYQSK